MAIADFDVTAALVRADYFPQLNDFTADSNPTAVSVARYINQEGGALGAALRKESQTPSSIDADTTTEAFAWCQRTLELMVAIRCLETMTQQNPELLKEWRAELKARLAALAEDAVGTLGGGSTNPATQPDGPTTHINNLNLDVGDTSLASDVIPPFRKSDLL